MIPGINEDIVRGNRTYHIQTEDRGERNPEIVSVLFLGGAVLTSDRVSYEDVLGSRDQVREVKKAMIRQHRGVLRRILSGEFDETSVERRTIAEAEPLLELDASTVPLLDPADLVPVDIPAAPELPRTLQLDANDLAPPADDRRASPGDVDLELDYSDTDEPQRTATGPLFDDGATDAPVGFCADIITDRPFDVLVVLALAEAERAAAGV